MSELRVHPIDKFAVELKVPGDKSISHRSVMFAAISNGTCEIDGFLPSEDCLATVGALKQLGVEIKSLNESSTKLIVKGNRRQFVQPSEPIDCGNSGTTMRLMCGLLAGCNFEVELVGDESLSKRPMDRIAKPLLEMGVSVRGQGKNCTTFRLRSSVPPPPKPPQRCAGGPAPPPVRSSPANTNSRRRNTSRCSSRNSTR